MLIDNTQKCIFLAPTPTYLFPYISSAAAGCRTPHSYLNNKLINYRRLGMKHSFALLAQFSQFHSGYWTVTQGLQFPSLQSNPSYNSG